MKTLKLLVAIISIGVINNIFAENDTLNNNITMEIIANHTGQGVVKYTVNGYQRPGSIMEITRNLQVIKRQIPLENGVLEFSFTPVNSGSVECKATINSQQLQQRNSFKVFFGRSQDGRLGCQIII